GEVAEAHNRLGITDKIPIQITNFHGRGYKVMDCKPFIQETEKQIKDPKLRNMRYVLGRIDQFIDHSRIGQENYVFRHMQDLIE
ncbi:MAG: hypothetical protein KW793_04695, partial [Candidatus Doudnabacteria bacterium]|nr:hypothetical protein [Candidatus Doudnabacteria bacterium]